MTGAELTAALAALGWSKGQLAALLACDRTLVHYWCVGRAQVPPAVGRWLRRAVAGLRSAGPPPVGWRVRLDLVPGDELVVEGGDFVQAAEHQDADDDEAGSGISEGDSVIPA